MIHREVLRRPGARRDIAEIALGLARDRPTTSERFLQALERISLQIAARPDIGAPYPVADPALARLRCVRVPRFRNHLVFYLTFDDRIEVVRVLHGARDVDSLLDDVGDGD
ncbi:MAG TPA: type II toxin-antitoxin system RelE/ParE family toxin [Isosphaeraceae bacterium]|nr:type II toxin-antitoxin system RelE/ParE family toxin [Isosphaeraceae bacterium]